jgi:glycosyltransferase involved in cell wall biosynthesis
LVPAADTKALQKAIEQLLQNPEVREAMGAQGKSLIQAKFSVEKMVAGNFAIYQRSIA